MLLSVLSKAASLFAPKNGGTTNSPCKNPAHCRVGICDVCDLALGDTTQKWTKFCTICRAWICDKCRPNYPLRAVAALKRKAGHYDAATQAAVDVELGKSDQRDAHPL